VVGTAYREPTRPGFSNENPEEREDDEEREEPDESEDEEEGSDGQRKWSLSISRKSTGAG
jgi:hypothetical protein